MNTETHNDQPIEPIHQSIDYSHFNPPVESNVVDADHRVSDESSRTEGGNIDDDGNGNADTENGVESERLDEEVGAVGNSEALDSDTDTSISANEIIENLFNISIDDDEQATFADRKYELRYWMAVVMARWPNLTETAIQNKFGIPRNTLRGHLSKYPVTHNYELPKNTKKYAATTADEIVWYLCKPNQQPEITDDTYTLRFWMSVITRRFQKMNRTVKQLAISSGISEQQIRRGSKNESIPPGIGSIE